MLSMLSNLKISTLFDMDSSSGKLLTDSVHSKTHLPLKLPDTKLTFADYDVKFADATKKLNLSPNFVCPSPQPHRVKPSIVEIPPPPVQLFNVHFSPHAKPVLCTRISSLNNLYVQVPGEEEEAWRIAKNFDNEIYWDSSSFYDDTPTSIIDFDDEEPTDFKLPPFETKLHPPVPKISAVTGAVLPIASSQSLDIDTESVASSQSMDIDTEPVAPVLPPMDLSFISPNASFQCANEEPADTVLINDPSSFQTAVAFPLISALSTPTKPQLILDFGVTHIHCVDDHENPEVLSDSSSVTEPDFHFANLMAVNCRRCLNLDARLELSMLPPLSFNAFLGFDLTPDLKTRLPDMDLSVMDPDPPDSDLAPVMSKVITSELLPKKVTKKSLKKKWALFSTAVFAAFLLFWMDPSIPIDVFSIKTLPSSLPLESDCADSCAVPPKTLEFSQSFYFPSSSPDTRLYVYKSESFEAPCDSPAPGSGILDLVRLSTHHSSSVIWAVIKFTLSFALAPFFKAH